MKAELLVTKALQSLDLNDPGNALACLQQAQRSGEAVRDLNRAWALYFIGTNQQRAARSSLELEIERFPDNQPARTLLADLTRNEEEAQLDTREIEGIGPRRFYLRKFPSSDESAFSQVFNELSYYPLTRLIDELKQTDRILTVLDAGANIGCSALYFAWHFPRAEILCVEPDPDNYNQLRKNIAVNDLSRATPLQAAVWNERGSLDIDPRFRDGREWSRAVCAAPDGAIPGFPLREMMALRGWSTIDLLKIDIEGAERVIFSDRNAMLGLLQSVRFLGIEIHDELNCRKLIEETLEAAGFSILTIGELTFGFNSRLIEGG